MPSNLLEPLAPPQPGTFRPAVTVSNELLAALQRSGLPQPEARTSPLAAMARPEPRPTPTASPQADIDRAAASIARIESGGRYDLRGPQTRTGDRAYGRYQVMGANVPQWTERWAGRRMTPDEFLADQAAQDAVFRGQFGDYLRRYGPQDAASMWFTGQPYSVGRTRSDAIPGVHPGLTGEQYVQRFMTGY